MSAPWTRETIAGSSGFSISHLRDSTATKDLAGVIGNVVEHTRRLVLAQRNRTSELQSLLFVAHIAHLVRNVLDPVVYTFNTGNLVDDHSEQR